MKLSEALAQRADIQKHMQQILERAKSSAKYQEGTKPAENSNDLMAEYERLAREFELLIQRINRTNSATTLGKGTITDAIATRDVLMLRADAARQLADAALTTDPRYGRSEILLLTQVDVAGMRKIADGLMKQHRELDHEIQAANWSTELLD